MVFSFILQLKKAKKKQNKSSNRLTLLTSNVYAQARVDSGKCIRFKLYKIHSASY